MVLNEVKHLLYQHTHPGIFLARPNRFVALVRIDGQVQRCHVKNTGRCAELLIPGVRVIVDKAQSSERITGYDLVGVWKDDCLINVDSSAPNKAFAEYLHSGAYIPNLTKIQAEARLGSSRLDFYAEVDHRRIWIEVKGVTLEVDGVAMFPDAPTERGVKHLHELITAVQAGCEAHAVFVIQMRGVRYFTPNARMHPAFAQALREAAQAGVTITALDCNVAENSMTIRKSVQVQV